MFTLQNVYVCTLLNIYIYTHTYTLLKLTKVNFQFSDAREDSSSSRVYFKFHPNVSPGKLLLLFLWKGYI